MLYKKNKLRFKQNYNNRKNNKGEMMSIKVHPRVNGVFLCKKGKDENLITCSFCPGKSIYSEKRISAINPKSHLKEKREFRVWNPYRSKLGASIVNGISNIYIKPGCEILYLGAASGTTVSHVADIVGPTGCVYAVEFASRCVRQLIRMAQTRTNVVPIFSDARKPNTYRLMVPAVDIIFSDVAQPDQTQIVMNNAKHFLKDKGEVLIAIKANCVNSLAEPEEVFNTEKEKLRKKGWQLLSQITLEPYQRHHAMITARFQPEQMNTN